MHRKQVVVTLLLCCCVFASDGKAVSAYERMLKKEPQQGEQETCNFMDTIEQLSHSLQVFTVREIL